MLKPLLKSEGAFPESAPANLERGMREGGRREGRKLCAFAPFWQALFNNKSSGWEQLMHKRQLCILLLIIATFGSLGIQPRAHGDAATTLEGMWDINFLVSDSPKGNRFGIPHRHNFEFREGNGECTVYSHDDFNILVPGVWRISGNDFSATFELYCINAMCGTIILRGSLDSETRMSGRAIIFWDSPDSTTPTGYDTVRGTFTGERLP